MAYGSILGQSLNTYTKDQILTSSVASLYGLGVDAVPNDIFQILSNSATKDYVESYVNNAIGSSIAASY